MKIVNNLLVAVGVAFAVMSLALMSTTARAEHTALPIHKDSNNGITNPS